MGRYCRRRTRFFVYGLLLGVVVAFSPETSSKIWASTGEEMGEDGVRVEAGTSASSSSRDSHSQPRPFVPTTLFDLEPWSVQQQTWPEIWQLWIPQLPPLPAPLAVGDFDSDGHVDIIVGEISIPGRIDLLLGDGTGAFTADRIVFQSDSSEVEPTVTLVPVDIDGDSDLDLYLVRWGRNQLLVNDGFGHFDTWESVMGKPLGLEDEGMGIAATFFDADGDGDLDLFVANIVERTGPLRGGRNRFYRNLDMTFVDETDRSQLDEVGMTVSLSTLDLDLDGHEDVAVTNYLGPCNIYRNTGEATFVLEEADSSALIHLGSDTADLDGDLRPDLLITAIGHPGEYFEPNHIRFSSSRGLHLGGDLRMKRFLMASWPHFCDYDNDGRTDIVFGRAILREPTPQEKLYSMWIGMETDSSGHSVPRFSGELEAPGPRARGRVAWTLARNLGSSWMDEVSLGPVEPSREATRAVVWVDADEDGASDLLVCEEGGKMTLFMNESQDLGKVLNVVVRTDRANRFGLGAQVYLKTASRLYLRRVKPGSSDLQTAEGVVCFGVGEEELRGLVIRWPHGGWQTADEVGDLEFDRVARIEIVEAPDRSERTPPSWLDLPFDGDAGHLGETEMVRFEKALLQDPTDFDEGWRYRQLCRSEGVLERPIVFFRSPAPAGAPFAWSLQRYLAYVDTMKRDWIEGDELARLAGMSVYELERLRILYPGTWIIDQLIGTNLLYWPPLFSQLDEAVEAFQRCRSRQKDRTERHLAETFVGLGDAYGLRGEVSAARRAWHDGLDVFPDTEALLQRMALVPGEVEKFCRLERSTERVPDAVIPWIEDEIAHTPLLQERSKIEEDRTNRHSLGVTKPACLNWYTAGRLLEEQLAAEGPLDSDYSGCITSREALSMEEALAHLRKGTAYLEYGFMPEHLEAADRELGLFTQMLLIGEQDEHLDPKVSTTQRTQRNLAVGLLGRGDAAMKTGNWRQGARLYGIAREIEPTNRLHRVRDLLPSTADPIELWTTRFRELPPCSND